MADKSEKRKELEARAEKAGLDYPHNIGDAKLEERVLAAEAAQGGGGQDAGGQTPPASTKPEGEPVVEVTGPKQGRRRAGHRFGPEPVLFHAGELTEDDLVALEADPLLTVVVRAADT
ncbi:hypothetical protein ACSQ8I_08380 [Marinovum sp. E06]|uniref:hypothetical protein n=1 Tax=unclassified Marinovum TaxID=2647166 RepID=UPI003EDBD4A3